MKKYVVTLILSIALFLPAIAQKNSSADKKKIIKEQAGRPDVPGDLFIETGFNYLVDNDEWKYNFWGSKVLNVYYQYDYNLGDSHFSFHPGIGIGTDKYDMSNETLIYGSDSIGNRILETIRVDSLIPGAYKIRKSKIATAYLEIPLELRFRSLKYDPKRSLKISVGGKIGFLVDSKTKLKYDAEGEKKVTKQKEDWGIRSIRYSVFGKVGYGNAYLFYNYQLSSLFDKNKGPNQTEMTPMTFGFALSLF